MSATPFTLDGQTAWAHDEGHAAGTFHTFDRFAPGGAAPRKLHVFLPRGWRESGERYPTVYLHDGHTVFWPGGVAGLSWDVPGVLSEARGRFQDVIVVAIHPIERDLEYTHVDWHDGRRPFGGVDAYTTYVADVVRPFVDAHYPTLRRADARAVVGSSHGGLASFWIATRRPEVFGIAGCLSPSFFSGIDSMVTGPRGGTLAGSALLRGIEELLGDPGRRPRLWICWGLARGGGDHNRIVEALAALRGAEMVFHLQEVYGYDTIDIRPGDPIVPGGELYWVEDPAAGHDEHAWRRRFGWWMQAFFPA